VVQHLRASGSSHGSVPGRACGVTNVVGRHARHLADGFVAGDGLPLRAAVEVHVLQLAGTALGCSEYGCVNRHRYKNELRVGGCVSTAGRRITRPGVLDVERGEQRLGQLVEGDVTTSDFRH
jgi:hypothetical protein